MKDKDLKKLRAEMAFSTVIKINFYSVLLILLFFFLFDDLLNDYIADKLLAFDGAIWYKIMEYKTPIVLIVYSVIVFVVSFFVIKRDNKYMDKVFTSINSIMENPNNEIKLKGNLELLEVELNKVRLSVLDSANKARDEENKRNDLIMYMAHDLKTPLTSVIGYLTLLNDEKKISKEMQRRYINIALEKALRVEDLTNQFFEITRYNLTELQINKKAIDLSLLLNQLVDECYPMLQDKNLELEVVTHEKIFYEGDGDLLARAFGNLIKNAINYSNDKTKIEINIKDNNDNIELIFKNEGDKIPDYKLEKLFEKFYRANSSRDSKTGGAGIGLSITKDIINLHNGDITVKNEGKYILFTIILPK